MSEETKKVDINIYQYILTGKGTVKTSKNGTPTREFVKCVMQDWPVSTIDAFDKATHEERKAMLSDLVPDITFDDAEVWHSPSLSEEGHLVPMRTYVETRGKASKK